MTPTYSGFAFIVLLRCAMLPAYSSDISPILDLSALRPAVIRGLFCDVPIT